MNNESMPSNGWRVIVDEGQELRALCKLQPLGDGGYSVLAPYHNAMEGWCARHTIDYNQTQQQMKFSDVEHFTANDRVKLSHHADGFVQFSGEQVGKIRSGRDLETGAAKGLAVQSARIDKPVTTGPTFAVVCWGPSDFRRIETPRDFDLIFGSADIYYRGCRPGTWIGYLLEG